MKKCPKCKANNSDNAEFCNLCMTAFDKGAPKEAPKKNSEGDVSKKKKAAKPRRTSPTPPKSSTLTLLGEKVSRKVVIIFSIVLVVVIAAASSGVYYLIWSANKNQKELQQEITNLKEENKALKRQNEKLQAEIGKPEKQQTGASDSSSEEEEEVSETDSIEQAIANNLKSEGHNPADFTVEQVKYKDEWATGKAVPSASLSTESDLYVLQKKNGEWVVVNHGPGLKHSDYPASPSEIW